MPTGSCLCGAIKIEFSNPGLKCICHCWTCKKHTSSFFSSSLLVPESDFRIITGTPKVWTKHGDDGRVHFTSHFCEACATTFWSESPGMPGTKIVKAGVTDQKEEFEKMLRPDMEIFTTRRQTWLQQVPGLPQYPQLPPMPGHEQQDA